ncbi:hypothetical protein SAMD00019534_043750 [Acytostelium subglobosum LB1]|uniref:hypothetical protein n=1 Tax=Acytostelium subglobosum LB1 TaxID=1410327 RepID=UPI000644FF9A|nr:hypothetical protein SAMD00019534_043750 [Acytostelium subglobosum LB1]GAM21200.1 hypothetical protein SAMD00019534_043750 [Acytostelium subglobosum LB1]|eukprot:XP_012756334.1 hypothetical protein SAMD00019534_043750 [Acytostelium subglobosum LB1]
MEEFGFNTDDLIFELNEPKQKKGIPKVDNYSPKIDSSLWFIDCDPTSIPIEHLIDDDKPKTKKERNKHRKMKDDNNEDDESKNERKEMKKIMRMLTYRIDHYYLNKKYELCLLDSVQLLKFVKALAGDNSQRMAVIEVEIRCLFKLARYQDTVHKMAEFERLATQPSHPVPTNIPKDAVPVAPSIFRDSSMIYILAQCHHHLAAYDEAIVQYQRAIGLNSAVWEWWLNLAQCYLNQPLLQRPMLASTTVYPSVGQDVIGHTPQWRLLCAKRSLSIALYYLLSSIQQKRSLPPSILTKGEQPKDAGWDSPLKRIHERLSSIHTTLIDLDANQLIALVDGHSFSEFETRWFVEYRERIAEDEEAIEEENPYAL